MNIYYSTPILNSKTSKGLSKFWQGHAAMVNEVDAGYFSESWQEKANGDPSSKLVSTISVRPGKNIGKKNETTSREQAQFEILAKSKKKIDGGYVNPDIASVAKLPLPMLAHTYAKRSHNIDWDGGVYVQPKLDGTRMLFDGRQGWSRQGKLYIPEVIAHLMCKLPPHCILDGELMFPLNVGSFQDSMKAIKKFRPGVSSKLVFHVYDILSPKGTFEQRTQGLAHLFYSEDWDLWGKDGFDIVETKKVSSEMDIKYAHEEYIKAGWEGVMIRNAQSVYKIGHRSADLQKLKHFIDDEFEIVGVLEGSGKEAGCAIFECVTKTGNTFKVRPVGKIEQRKLYFLKAKELIGVDLTVRFQELTDDGIPRFPVGIQVRDYE